MFDDLFGGSESSVTTKPWSQAQRTALNNMYREALALYKRTGGDQYGGELYAGINPMQTAAANTMNTYAQGPGAALASGAGGVATQYMGAAPAVLGNLGDIYGRMGKSSAPGILSDAAMYADNPYMQQMIQAATRDDVRGVTEGVLPQIEAGAVGTGNTNSSRTAMASAVAQRGLADRIADTSAVLRGGAYQQGLGLAAGDQQFRTGAQLAATNQLGGAVGTGLSAAPVSQGMAYDNANAGLAAGSFFQADEQAKLDALLKKWQLNTGLPWERLAQLGGLSIPSTGTTGTVPGASPFQQVVGGTAALGGAAGKILAGLG